MQGGSTMKKFEYKVVMAKTGAFTTIEKIQAKVCGGLNELGGDGWELVNCVPVSLGELFMSIFKREIQE
jgi:hypothetical protein